MPVLSFVSARVSPDGQGDVTRQYSDAVRGELAPGVRQTFLLVGDDGTMAMATVWNSRADLREAGDTPDVKFFDLQVKAQSSSR